MNENFCVILAGGKGRRLWPCSRENMPKQFIDFFGTGETQLQMTYHRMARFFNADHIFIATNEVYSDLVREQLPELPERNILAEPIYRNTAPSVARAAHLIAHFHPEASLAIIPSDQMVFREEEFQKNINEGLEFANRNDSVVVLGVKPTRPEPGYGYIQIGDYSNWDDTFKVKSFIEKPDRNFAKMFMESGEWYWNTGIFISKASTLLRILYDCLPVVLRNLDKQKPDYTYEDEQAYVREHFPSYTNLSIDYGILERSENVYVMKSDFGWADLGTWHGIYEAKKKGEDDNVVIDTEAYLEDSKNNIIKLPKGRLAVINGLDGFIVAEKDNVLLICKKEDSSALIRKYVNEIQLKKGEEYI
ncbi:mannose-1-phosphate guanylyltransferase [Prevotella sp. AGR2160]|uniref:mannose-1-phosphate guanylyltransferase n=1 Tax=Prevotella sp. AGR2160 TaxID=1280674 RepID=UPI0005638FF7|nr:sugar phosphate nucleotidyltransferase [Prevotella sp. AGR2160]